MIIKNIQASNFKTFNDLNVDLNQINIHIGANASGKSNFTDVFRFIRDISNHGLKNAISMQGGLEYLRNIHCNMKDIHFKIQLLGENDIFIRKIKRNWIAIKANDLTYSFTLSYKDKLEDFQTSDDELFVNYEFFKLKSKKDLKDEKKTS